MMDSNGWVEIVQPLLDKMIKDCTGYVGAQGEWIAGEIQRHPEKAEALAHYSGALIEFSQRLNDHFIISEKIKEHEVRKEIKVSLDSVPLQDTRYT
jgi:hypothetical protein